MLINEKDQIGKALAELAKCPAIAIDTETTGLYPYHGDTFFSFVMYGGKEAYYFDFNDLSKKYLSFEDLSLFSEFFQQSFMWIGHNLKFDLAMLRTKGVKLRGTFHDTMVVERLLDSTLMPGQFSLAATARRYDMEKLDNVENYIKAHRLYDVVVDIATGKTVDKPLYKPVPLSEMQPYAERDTMLAFRLHERQLTKAVELKIDRLYENECELLGVVSEMEARGVRIDMEYVRSAFIHETVALAKARATFESATGTEFVDSPAALSEVFADKKPSFIYGEATEAGTRNPSFDADWLSLWPDDIRAKAVLECRSRKSNADYYSGFARMQDSDNLIHANFNQHQTRTGRFSSSAPNLQNLTNTDESAEYNVRAAIVPYHKGWWLGSIDFDQIEYRIAVEYSGCPVLSSAINSGLDVHGAMAQVASIPRQEAKAVNFAILFGSGDRALATTLKKTVQEVGMLKRKIFAKSPRLSQLLQKVVHTAETRKFITLWLGRVLSYPVLFDKYGVPIRTSYKAVNGLCQGNAADIIKVAMVRCEKFLTDGGYKTMLLMTVHDELIFSGPPEEEHLLKDLTAIMSSVYPSKHVPITASPEYSYENLSRMKKWVS